MPYHLHGDRARAEAFGSVAEQYDRARPTYPAELVDFLTGAGTPNVLDVGCGTGIVARLFLALGCRVLGVEVDERMAEVARRQGLTVELGRFETWPAEGRQFDLLTSGQAWHWVDPIRGPAKAAEVVRGGGRIGMFWNRGAYPEDLQDQLDRLYQLEPELIRGYAEPCRDRSSHHDQESALEQLRAAEPWEDVATVDFTHAIGYTTAAWLDQMPTHSDHLLLPADRKAALLEAVGEAIDAYGGAFEMTYTTSLVTARRRD